MAINLNVTRANKTEYDAQLLLGVKGDTGKSAYQYAVDGGYEGSETDFLNEMARLTTSADEAAASAEAAQDALDEFVSVTATAETLPAGSDATASYSEGELTLGIPKGDKGDKGDTYDDSAIVARMDSFTQLAEGSTAGDAELIDGRVGADGVTYNNIGGAIRAQVTDLKSDLNGGLYIEREVVPVKGCNISGATDVDDTFTPTYTANTGWWFAVVNVKKGDAFTIQAKGGAGFRLYRFVDENSVLKQVASASQDASVTPITVKVQNDGVAYFNCNNANTHVIKLKRYVNGFVDDELKSDVAYKEIFVPKGSAYSGTNDYAASYNPTVVAATGWASIAVSVKAGEEYVITGKGGENYRLYVLTDSTGMVVNRALTSESQNSFKLFIEQDGTLYFNANILYDYSLLKRVSKVAESTSYYYAPSVNTLGVYSGTNTVGSSYSPTFNYSTSWYSAKFDVKEGDVVTITGKGGSGYRLYVVTDADGLVVNVASADQQLENAEIEITEDGTFYANLNKLFDYAISVKTGIKYVTDSDTDKVDNLYADYVPKSVLFSRAMPDADIPITSVAHDLTAYAPLQTIYDGYDALVSAYPDYVTKTLIGNDASGDYQLYRYEFTPSIPEIMGNPIYDSNYTVNDFPVVVLDACLHGSERPCALALLNFMAKVAESFNENNIFGWMRSNIKFVVCPIANPWGYVNNTRYNANHVDLNRNFIPFWANGGSGDPTSNNYRGASALSEVETQYIYNYLNTNKEKILLYYGFHTFGEVAQGYNHMSCFFNGSCEELKMQKVGIATLVDITKSGWKNHNLPTNSGIIGQVHNALYGRSGNACWQGGELGIPSACPEVMYKYYDGTSGSVYNTDTNCMNAEWIAKAVAYGCKMFLNL